MHELAPKTLRAMLRQIDGDGTATIVIEQGSAHASITFEGPPQELSGTAEIELEIGRKTIGATGWVPIDDRGLEASIALRWSDRDVAGTLCLIEEIGNLVVYTAERRALAEPSDAVPADHSMVHASRLVAHHLIGVLKDAAHGWRVAAEVLTDDPVVVRFGEIAIRREEMAATLATFTAPHDDVVSHRRSIDGALHLWWLHLRRLMPGTTSDSIVATCRRGAKAALQEFDEALREPMTDDLRRVLTRHRAELADTVLWIEGLRVRPSTSTSRSPAEPGARGGS